MAYCSNIKFNTINNLLQADHDYIFYFDVDTIIRKDISGLIKLLESNDIVIRRTKTNPNKPISEPGNVLYQLGLFGVRNTPATKRFFNQLEDIVNKDLYNWDIDQIEFAALIDLFESDIIIGDMPETYKDETLNESSHIWCGAGTKKMNDVHYLQEMSLYR